MSQCVFESSPRTGSNSGYTTLDLANDINDSGQIVGYGEYWTEAQNEVQAFLLTPVAVPELASWLLGVVALGTLVVASATNRLKSVIRVDLKKISLMKFDVQRSGGEDESRPSPIRRPVSELTRLGSHCKFRKH